MANISISKLKAMLKEENRPHLL
ncbi:hypothetical protein MNBD_NITROSPINAE05-1292, partial [hydrothermal vent metagenome]